MKTTPKRATLAFALLATFLFALPAAVRAEDEEGTEAVTTIRYEVRQARAHPTVPAPALMLPSDADGQGMWRSTFFPDNEPILSFGEDEEPGYGVETTHLLDLLYEYGGRLNAFEDDTSPTLSADGPFHVVVEGTAEGVRRGRRALDWIVSSVAPTLPVRAALFREGEDPALLTAGTVRLQPGAWVGVYRQVRRTPLAVEWEIEIAQESTAMHPVVAQVPEGEELYLRFHPGETVSVVEMWTGTLAHLEVFEVDLSRIRNVPEAGGPGKLQLPQTAGYRTYTAFAVPSGRTSRREFRWNGPAGPVRLVLDLEAPGPSSTPEPLNERHHLALRAGAAGAPLAFERREYLTETILDAAQDGFDGDGTFSVLTPGFLYYQGDGTGARRLAAALKTAEARLTTHHLGVRLLTVSEESLRGALRRGSVMLGRAIDAEVLTALGEEGGSVPAESVELHLLDGLDASFRAGKSVLGLVGLDVEVAQQAGGSDPVVDPGFDGLAGEVSVRRIRDGLLLDLHARVDHADAQAGTIEVVHRPPVGMASERNEFPAPSPADIVRLPMLGGDTAVVASTALLPEDGREILVDVVIRGGEASLVLARLLR